jgi:hypothetical protein
MTSDVDADITITLTFLRTMPSPEFAPPSLSQHSLASTMRNIPVVAATTTYANEFSYDFNDKKTPFKTEIIDTQAPLALKSGQSTSFDVRFHNNRRHIR